MGSKKRYVADYDFEEAYNKAIEDMEQDQLERYMKEKRAGIAYQTKTTKAGDQLEADIYPVFGNRQDAPRTKRRNESRPAQKNLNNKRARRYLNNLVNANFGEGDLWCTFTYDDKHLPADPDEADRRFANFIRRVNRRRKKAGLENVKYICVTEYVEDEGKKTRCHHHVIMSGDVDRDELEKVWGQGKRNHTRRIDPDPRYKYRRNRELHQQRSKRAETVAGVKESEKADRDKIRLPHRETDSGAHGDRPDVPRKQDPEILSGLSFYRRRSQNKRCQRRVLHIRPNGSGLNTLSI